MPAGHRSHQEREGRRRPLPRQPQGQLFVYPFTLLFTPAVLSNQDITGTKLFSGVNRLPIPGEGGGCGDGGGLITDGLLGGSAGYDDAESKDDGAYATQVGSCCTVISRRIRTKLRDRLKPLPLSLNCTDGGVCGR